MTRRVVMFAAAVTVPFASGCGDDPVASAVAATTVSMDYTRPSPFSAPWPSETLRRQDGGVAIAGFPDPTGAPIVGRLVDLIEADARGFSTTAGIFFTLSGPLGAEPAAPSPPSADADASVFLVPIAGGSVGERHPIEIQYRDDGGPFGAPRMLSILPLQGIPLAPRTLHAAVVTRALLDAAGAPLGASPAVSALARGEIPAGMSEAAAARYREAIDALAADGVSPATIAGLAVFETDDPTLAFRLAAERALAEPAPALETPFAQTDLFDELCVYEATLPMPVYQAGEPPFSEEGGGWKLDADGAPVLQTTEAARIVVTIPRAPAPPGGYPIVLFSRTGGGGDRPLVDRGQHAEPHGEAIEPGSGPAREFASVGFAGASVDGPHGGIRNVTGGDEQFLMFNVENPTALRDNVRQSAIELVVQSKLLETLVVDTADCPGASPAASFDASRFALMGHSMGATITPLTMSAAPSFRALVLSGAGGSYIANVVHKQSPVPVRGLAELILGVAGEWQLHEHDPVLTLLQWAAEPADPPVYAAAITATGGRHVLMLQGIVDTYILPPIANSLSLALGLDLAGDPLDAGNPELEAFSPLEPLLPYSGGERIALPASGNRDGATLVVVQHAEDGIEDGHEVVFQTEPPKAQYRCLLSTIGSAAPTVPAAGGSCP